MHTFIEYRVRPVTRYVLTRYERQDSGDTTVCSGSSECLGEFERADTAWHIGKVLASHDELQADQCPAADMTFEVVSPEHPDHTDAAVGQAVQPFR